MPLATLSPEWLRPLRNTALLRLPADQRSGVAVRAARLLLVEDDFIVGVDLERRLIEAGFVVVGIAATAEEAWEKAVAEKPELAIVDIRLAGLRDGVDAAIELLTKLSIPSVFATAHGDPETKKRAQAARPRGWLQKPYSDQALVDTVNAALQM
jgi:DNA-binding NarL/FixJ family response regulator